MHDGQDLKAIPGIGKAISQNISELVFTGKLDFFEQLSSEFLDGILEVMRVPGVGLKTAKRLWDELGVTSVAQFEGAILNGSLASLPRMVAKKAVGGIKVLSGSELDIRADGNLDYPDDVLATLDWVVASIHSELGQPRDTMTERIIKAMQNPHVTVIGHLSARMLGECKGIDADFEAFFVAVAETGTVLEINASPERLDLRDSHIRRAIDLGVVMAIDSDAHTVAGLDNQRYCVGIVRRAWCQAHHIVNTLPTDAFMDFLSVEKSRRPETLQAYA